MTLDIILTIIGFILMLVGLVGCIAPVIPGVVLSYIGILLLHFTSRVEFSTQFLIGWALTVVVVELLNYFIPIWGARRLGGGNKASVGCTLGMVAGIFFFPPWGIIIFPFVGAVLGELIDGRPLLTALRTGSGAFVGFVAGTLMQLVVALLLLFFFVKEVVVVWW